MTDQIDAVNPANIPANYDGQPAARITVFASPAGQAFDVSDTGNAGPVAVARAVASRYQAGKWSLCYVNQSGYEGMTQALELVGLGWTDASQWPRRGAYLWCADPSRNIATGAWVLPVVPVAVQDRYLGSYDLSTISGPYSGRVAGYIDGPNSQWPAAAWDRFTTIPDTSTDMKEDTVLAHFNDAAGNNYVLVEAGDQPGHLLRFRVDPGAEDVVDVTDAATAKAHQNNPADTRTYTIKSC